MGKVTVGRFLKNNIYYVGSYDEKNIWVSIDASDDFTMFDLHEDERGKYFIDEDVKVYLDFA